MSESPKTRIETLLKVHGGKCFIPAQAYEYDELLTEAVRMTENGEFKLLWENLPKLSGFTLTKKGYRVRRLPVGETEPVAH